VKVHEWREEAVETDGGRRGSKRTWSQSAQEGKDEKNSMLVRKKLKTQSKKSEEVMSEAWRARRRLQEKKAGWWTDGTVRMDRLWEGFYWVLNVDDPDDVRTGEAFGGGL
jgi:hypothetical protein